jgi:hypothetical protein
MIAYLLTEYAVDTGGGHFISIHLQLNIEVESCFRDVTEATLPANNIVMSGTVANPRNDYEAAQLGRVWHGVLL